MLTGTQPLYVIGLMIVLRISGLLLSAAAQSASRTLWVDTGPGLVAAIADPQVATIVLLGDVSWREADWGDYATPVPVLRNLSIQGNGSPQNKSIWPTLDMGFVSRKARLGARVTLTFRYLVVRNWRWWSHNLAPGMDFLAPELPGDTAVVLIERGVLEQRACYPSALALVASRNSKRPIGYPGIQEMVPAIPQEGCINVTDDGVAAAGGVHTLQRCWLVRGLLVDIAYDGADWSFNFSGPVPNGYVTRVLDTEFLCNKTLSESCVTTFGPVGCWTQWLYGKLPTPTPPFDPLSAAPGAAVTADTGTGAEGGIRGGLSYPQELGVILGCVLGGCLLLAVVALVVMAVRKRRSPCHILGNGSGTTQGGLQACTGPSVAESPDQTKSDKQGQQAAGQATTSSRNTSDSATTQSHLGLSLGCLAASASRYERSVNPAGGGGADTTERAALHPGVVPERIAGVVAIALHGRTSFPPPLLSGSETVATCQHPADDVSTPRRPTSASAITLQPSGLSPLGTDPLAFISPLSPPREDCCTTVEPVSEVRLLPRVLGKGAFGRVVEGEYQGQRVAVKLLTEGMLQQAWRMDAGPAVAAGSSPQRPAADPSQSLSEAVGAAGAGSGEGKASAPPDAEEAPDWVRDKVVQEVQVLGRCQHPNVVRLLAACLTPPRMCLVMELMDSSLERLLYGRPGELLPMDTVLDIALDVARGLEYLHPTVVHRDVKPGNILVKQPPDDGSSRLVAKLSDFGLSRLRSTVAATLTPDAGTPEYMAPELFDAQNIIVTHKVDIYSFGVVIWTMLTGMKPWENEPVISLAFKVSFSAQRLPLGAIPLDRGGRKLEQLLILCWEHDPERRPAAAEVVKALLLLKEQRLQVRQETSTPPKPDAVLEPR